MTEGSMLARARTTAAATLLAVLMAIAVALSPAALEEARAQGAGAKLSELPVRSEGSTEGYARDDYPHWSNAQEFGWRIPAGTPDADSCDTREAALIRDGRGESVGSGCEVSGGRWQDPYTGQTLTETSDLDADHVVPLAESYRSGSARWSEEKKERFANAPAEVLMVDDGANASKSDSDPAEWKPPRQTYWCTYARKWINVKYEWDLSVDPAEKRALRKMLATCSAKSAASPHAGQTGEQPSEQAQQRGDQGTSQKQSSGEYSGGQPAQAHEDHFRTSQAPESQDRQDIDRGGPSNEPLVRLPDTGGPALFLVAAVAVGGTTLVILLASKQG